MNLKNKLKEYIEVIKGINNGNIELTDEQFEFLKAISLKKGIIVGMHSTIETDVNLFFNIGLYNNSDYGFKDTCDLTNTVAYSSIFLGRLWYHHPGYTTILLMIPEDVIEGKKGIFEKLSDGGWGIPPQYIIGAFKNKKIFLNKNYDEKYSNSIAYKVEEPEVIFRKFSDLKEEISVCSKAFYDAQFFKSNKIDKAINRK